MTVGELKEFLEAIPDGHIVRIEDESGRYSPNLVRIREAREGPEVEIAYVHPIWLPKGSG